MERNQRYKYEVNEVDEKERGELPEVHINSAPYDFLRQGATSELPAKLFSKVRRAIA